MRMVTTEKAEKINPISTAFALTPFPYTGSNKPMLKNSCDTQNMEAYKVFRLRSRESVFMVISIIARRWIVPIGKISPCQLST